MGCNDFTQLILDERGHQLITSSSSTEESGNGLIRTDKRSKPLMEVNLNRFEFGDSFHG
jgi:hypothetical protein